MPAIKLIIWDLDDTLWQGTLADGDAVQVQAHRAELIRAFNAKGVVSSLCSKNDFAAAKAQLEALGLWDEFVFPHIAFTPKAAAVNGIIGAMQLRPANVLFVDDNGMNLREVGHLLPDIQLLDITAPDADDHLAGLLAVQTGTRSRVADYRMLERKARDRAESGVQSNADFLHSCEIRASAPCGMDNLEFAGRIAELINRSNQLNYTQSRVEQAALERDIMNVVAHDSWSIFAWDKYGDYGLVGFAMVDRQTGRLVHFTFSCRAMHMGLEGHALGHVRSEWPDIDASAWQGRFDPGSPDWVENVPFNAAGVRERLRASQQVEVATEPAIRIMFDCQSGGIAHFSRFRPAIEFDNNPRLFALRMMEEGGHDAQNFPPFLVYGAAVDYLDHRWPKSGRELHDGLYERSVERMTAFLVERDLRMLVILPPEEAPEEKYRAGLRLTRDRAHYFNWLWRQAARAHPDRLWILDVADIAEPDEMADVTHYHSGLLKKIADQLDGWIEAVALGGGAQAEAA